MPKGKCYKKPIFESLALYGQLDEEPLCEHVHKKSTINEPKKQPPAILGQFLKNHLFCSAQSGSTISKYILIPSLSILFLATSCVTSRSWVYQEIATGESQYDSCRIVYPAHDKVNDIEIEILKTSATCTLSLKVHGQPITSCENDPEHAYVQVKIGDQNFTELASLHAGGQRLRLSPALQESILASLRGGNPILIELSGYKKKITADNFPSLAEKLDALSHFRNPIQLSL